MYQKYTSQDGIHQSRHHCAGCCPLFRSIAPVVVSVPYDDILDPPTPWLHPLLHVSRRWLGWSTVNQGLVAASGFIPICRVSLTAQPCFYPWVGWAVAGWFIITGETCSVTRCYQLLMDTHTLSPPKKYLLSVILTQICVYIDIYGCRIEVLPDHWAYFGMMNTHGSKALLLLQRK